MQDMIRTDTSRYEVACCYEDTTDVRLYFDTLPEAIGAYFEVWIAEDCVLDDLRIIDLATCDYLTVEQIAEAVR